MFCSVTDVLTAVPYKEKPVYNTKRRTTAHPVSNPKSHLAPLGHILLTRQLSNSTPQLQPRDPDCSSITSGHSGSEQIGKSQRPLYDSDSPYVDSISGGNLQLASGYKQITRKHSQRVNLR